jgi:DNA-binding protein HU-beta
MGRNPQTGQEIRIPARKRLKFVVAKAAKDAALGSK